jgi:hypothetical protein
LNWSVNEINGFHFRSDSTNSSNNYLNASGGNNLLIRNSDNSGTYEIITPILNANGLSNLSISWGSRVSVNFTASGSQTPQLFYSTNGLDWNELIYSENDANSIWSLVNNGVSIALPSNADNASAIQFKWTIQIINDPNGTYRMDDIHITGLTPMMTPVTFWLDMSQEILNPSGVHLQGNFQGWNPSSLPMSGSGVYHYTGAFNIGDTLYYRFVNGNVNNLAETISGLCSATNSGYNCRMHIVGNTTDTVCFSSCNACIPPVYNLYGCTDPTACNFNVNANVDDGTCLITGASCNDGSAITVNDIVNNDCWCQGTLSGGQCSDLFISEYVEGLGNNRAIEIYNPTNANVDLSAYGLVRYSNGNATPGDISFLNGAQIASHDVYVVALDKRDPLGTGLEAPIFPELELAADTFINPLSSGGTWPMYFSGNDAIALVKDNGATQVDLFGKIGEGAGFGGWNAYGTSILGTTLYISENHTLLRKSNISNGVVINPPAFDVLIEYDSLPNNTFSDLGFHDCQCNVVATPGCNSPSACNYNPNANQNDGTCIFMNTPCNDQDPNTVNDMTDINCVCHGILYILGCTDNTACNYQASANIENGSCLYTNQNCNDGNNNTMNDIVDINCQCVGINILEGCMNIDACNYNAQANLDDGSCFSINDPCNDGNASTINDFVDVNCLCNGAIYLPGCTNALACNFNPSATADNGSCLIAGAPCDDSNTATINDLIDNNCNCAGMTIVLGCTNAAACNYNSSANQDNGTCIIIGSACNDNNGQTINDIINTNCNCEGTLFILGCNNPSACNYNSIATNNDGSCILFNDPCDDQNPLTINDVIDSTCSCSGIVPPGCPDLEVTATITPAICAGDQNASIQLNINTPNLPVNILWNSGDTSATLDSLTFGWYFVSITDSLNCTEIDSFFVSPSSLSPIQIVLDSITHNDCFGYHDGAISIHANGGSGLYYLTWDTNPIQTAISITGLAAGSYTAHIEDTNGCSANEIFQITQPSGQFPNISGPISVDNLMSTSYNTNFVNNYSYSWNVTGGVITNGTDSTVNVQWGINMLGSITVTQIDSSGCTLSETIYVQVGTSVQEINEAISVYPNPTMDNLFIQSVYSFQEIRILNEMGQEVYRLPNVHSINVENLPSGVYFLHLKTFDQSYRIRWIKL